MRRVIAVCGILLVLFALGAFAQGYAEGYEDGKQDVREDVSKADFVSVFTAKFATAPTERVEQIQNMSEAYQKGYLTGYKENSAQTMMRSPKWWLGFILEFVALGLVIALLLSVMFL